MRNPLPRRPAAQPGAEISPGAEINPCAGDHDDAAVPAGPPGFGAYLRYFLGLGTSAACSWPTRRQTRTCITTARRSSRTLQR